MITCLPPVVVAKERTLDDRCDGHAKYVIKLLKNKYEGESLEEQLDLVNEWSDPIYKKEIQLVLTEIVYKLPMVTNEKDLVIQSLENYIGAYRGCIQSQS